MHPLGRNDKRALKLPLLGFNGVIDPNSAQWHICGSLVERPSSNVAAIDRYDRSARRKNISDVSCALLPLHTKHPVNVHPSWGLGMLGFESSSFYICATRASTDDQQRTAHQMQPERNTPSKCDLLSRSLPNTPSLMRWRKGVSR